MGCRIFYLVMYGLFYTACGYYPNQLTGSIAYFFCYYIPIAALAATFFLNTGNNPGYLADHPCSGHTVDDIELQQVQDKTYEIVSVDEKVEHFEQVELPTTRFCNKC